MAQEHGFELLRERTIPEINVQAQLFRHAQTGAHLLALRNDDENKTFSVAFRTLANDHTGVPHIIEHAVLCGSRQYPVKEPFVELLKGSLATYLNAATSLDNTYYPVASQNLEDFYNLVDVYLDAVLHPLLTRPTFDQEGWHYELEEADGPLAYRGIVFNEMKGEYSTPDVILMLQTLRALFPNTAYGWDVGGDPEHIPALTYEQFRTFYATHYHPANALFFLYGDLPIAAGLERVDRALAGLGPGPAVPPPALQPPFAAPRAIAVPYPVSAEEEKAYVTVTWVTVEDADPVDVLASAVLSYALIGSPASPLRKELVDSGLGEDLALLPDWFLSRQLLFSAGLKGVAPENVGRVEPLIQRTLETLAREDLEPEMVEAAVNTVEFALHENSGSEGQPGIQLFERAAASWLHGGDPFAPLAFAAPLARLKANLAAEPRYLARLIQTYLLDNPHRLTVLLQPDPLLQQRQEAAEQARLAAARAAMTAAERQAVVENTRALRRLQETPNSPENLATLPVLQRSDLDPQNRPIPLEVGTEAGSRVLYHPLPTNGIVYLDLGLDLRLLSQEDLPYATVLGRVLLEMGTAREDYVRLTQRIGRTTGGIAPAVLATAAHGAPEGLVWLLLRGKAMADRGTALLEILRDVLLTVRLDNPERFRQIVGEEKARREAELLPLAARVTNARLSAHFGQAGWASDAISGLGGLFALRQLAQDVERDWPAVLARLEAIRAVLVNRTALLANVTLDPSLWAGFRPALASFLADLPGAPACTVPWTRPALPAGEGFSVPSTVNYVGKGADLYALGYTLDGSILAINRYLDTTWLWDKVRAQGGAYGGMAVFNHRSGMFNYLSYRDPNLLQTLDNYDGSAGFLRQLDLSEAELTKSIIGGISEMDSHMLPAAKGLASLARYLTGDTDERRQQLREELLSTTVEDFRRFAEVLDAVRREGHLVILGAEEALRAADEQRGGGWLALGRAL